ncbi:trypsin-like peptidase domain-containing protein [Paenibacillus aurantius]|uniref:Trypsin-like peptidase domain-containing protein n=1 Tax=Paenibacillus aurantius TaxID=2918900 RepID=A0AA96LAQ7_9BACL|nr:trypsin-like peptidase domain-containing protein [Paenibacillus aurantius]WNQ10191.1 trypsin-like peptidase domain-containing protein [Paenibacillus aurantius]
MDDNKRDYDDFFRSSDNRSEQDRSEQDGDRRDETAGKEQGGEKPSYYYSYGPYKSQENTSITPSDGVEMTPPRPVRPLDGQTDAKVQQPLATWSANPSKPRSRFRSTFAAFMAGAVLVGGLMFASDKSNLFTGSQGVMSGTGGSSSAAASNNSSVKGAALDIARPNNIAQIVQNSSPAVVKIETFVKPKASSGRGRSLLDDPFFRQFFGDGSGGSESQPNTAQPVGMGSGFIFEKSGYILTNQHVVDGADEIQVTIEGNDKPYTAKLLGNSADLDLAVIKIEGDNFPVLPMAANTDQINVGDWVVAIGNPYGFDHTVTVGVLSAKEREIPISEGQTSRTYKHLMQTDASINPGNSGGPLLNLNGEVVGINTAVSAQAQGIGFAIPINTIQEVVDKLKNNVKIPKEPAPYVGVSLGNIDQNAQKQLGLSSTDGAYAADVVLGSPAFKAGIKKYDVITGINGTPVKNSEELVKKIQASKVGDKITLNLIRDGKKVDVEVTVGDRNNDENLQQQQQQQ